MKYDSIREKAVTFLFCGLLFSFFFASLLLPKKVFSESENRYLAQRPRLQWQTLKSGAFGRDYETYLGDQFPMRELLVTLKTGVALAQGKKEISGVFLGKEQFLIEALYPEDIDQALYHKNIARLRDFALAQAQNLGEDHVRILLAPSSSKVLSDHLPRLAAPFDQSQTSDDLLASCGRKEDRDALARLLVPARAALEESHREEPEIPLYYRTDHHWTSHGAYVAYRAWIESCGGTAVLRSDFSQETVTDGFSGTLQAKLKFPVPPDSIELYLPKNAPDYDVFFDMSTKPVHSLYSMEALATRDKYRVFLDGNHALTKIVNRSAAPRRLLLIKDSYAHSFAPFASLHYEEVHMLDLRYYNGKISDYMKDQKITDVLVLYQIPGFAADRNLGKLRE